MTSDLPSTPRRRFRAGLYLGFAFITTIAVALATFAAVRALQPAGPAADLISINNRNPVSFSAPTLDRGLWSTRDHAGQIIVLNYFATWCPPCNEELPDLKQVAADYAPRGVTFAAISVDADPAALAQFAANEKLPFPILHPPAGSPLIRDIDAVPQTLLIDRRGKIAFHITGKTDAKELAHSLDQLLKE